MTVQMKRTVGDIIVGVDTDKKHYVFTVREQGVNIMHKTLVAVPAALHNYIKKQFPGKNPIYVYEAGPTGFGLYDYLTALKVPCHVISTLSMPVAKCETVKNNGIDSRKLAEYMEAGKLRSIRVPMNEYRELRHLTKVRELCVSYRTKAKQRIKGLLLYSSISDSKLDASKHWSTGYIGTLRDLKITPAERYRLDCLLEDLDYARLNLIKTHKELKTFCKTYPNVRKNVKYLESIPGIGFITAVTILGKIGEPSLLRYSKEIASFLGLTQWEYSTGDVQSRGSITHFGNKVLRKLLVECAWAAIRKDVRLNQFYHRIKNRNNPKYASQIAIVAVARKMTQIIYRVLKEQRCYAQY